MNHNPNPNPLTVQDVLERNAAFERECIEAARKELATEHSSTGVGYIGRLITRAQQIKERRKSNGEKTC